MRIQDWGLIDYAQACERQLALVDSFREDHLIFCTHPPVVTTGRATSAEDIIGWSGDLIETPRGGRATYHGPSQIVIYPILDLSKPRAGLKERDIHAYLRSLEETTAAALRELGLAGAERQETPAGELLRTGVWVGERKIASVGIAVRKWISYHGVAINVLDDPTAHRGIRPCGFTTETMTSVERELGARVDVERAKRVLKDCFEAAYSVRTE